MPGAFLLTPGCSVVKPLSAGALVVRNTPWLRRFAGVVSVFEYCLYGASIAADIPLFTRPGPPTVPISGSFQPVRLVELSHVKNLPALPIRHEFFQAHGRSLWLESDRGDESICPGQAWQLTVEEVVSFGFVSGEPTVYYRLQGKGSRALLAFWFTHLFLPLYLTIERGYDFIHAAAVEVDEHPILFIAESTGGKSTLGDYFLKQGHPMLSDDKVATFLRGGQFYAAPSHPHHRPWRQFEVLGDPVEHFATSAKPIHAFYLLERSDPLSPLEITEVTGFRKFEGLMPNYLFNFPFLLVQRLRWLAQLADQSLCFG